MKKVLLAVIVALGLQTQAQVTCDSITTTYVNVSPTSIEATTNVWSFGIPWTLHAFDLYEGCQLATLTQSELTSDTNNTVIMSLPSPNLVDTFIFCAWSDFAVFPYSCYPCDTFAWNGNNWAVIQHQQIPYFCCDSITYNIDQSQGFNISLDTTGIVHNPDSINVYWSICTNGLCYADQGMFAYFPQVTTSDTLKVGYDVMIYENGVIVETCTIEEWLVFDGTNWVLLNTIPTSINELISEKVNDGKIYDLLGREVNKVQAGTMYIKNNKKYIILK